MRRLLSTARSLFPMLIFVLVLATSAGPLAIYASSAQPDALPRPVHQDAPPALVSSEPANGATWHAGAVTLDL